MYKIKDNEPKSFVERKRIVYFSKKIFPTEEEARNEQIILEERRLERLKNESPALIATKERIKKRQDLILQQVKVQNQRKAQHITFSKKVLDALHA